MEEYKLNNEETLDKLTIAAKSKVNFLKSNFFAYLVSSCFAGLYVGIGILLIFTIGGLLVGTVFTKIIMGLSFAIALTLVIFTGSELFTGNNMIMMSGTLNKGVSPLNVIKVWIVSYIGNLIGSIIVGSLFVGTGFVNGGAIMEFFANTALAKSSVGASELFFRGILCNILVCVAVLCCFKTKNDTAKILIIFMCLFAFITSGFEHSVANMTIYAVALLEPSITTVTLSDAVYNIGIVTIGNIVGGALFLGGGAYILGRKNNIS